MTTIPFPFQSPRNFLDKAKRELEVLEAAADGLVARLTHPMFRAARVVYRLPRGGVSSASYAAVAVGCLGLWYAFARGHRRTGLAIFALGLALTVLLGLLFLSLQGYEYSRQPFTPATNAYGSAFFTITGMHGTHVFVGLLVLTVVSVMAARGKFGARNHAYVSNAALYWHFVDVVWIVLFTTLYILPGTV